MCTEMRFASSHSSVFTTMAVINPQDRKLAKRTSVMCTGTFYQNYVHSTAIYTFLKQVSLFSAHGKILGLWGLRLVNRLYEVIHKKQSL